MYNKKIIEKLKAAEIITKPSHGWLYSINESVGNYGYIEIDSLDELDLFFDGIENIPCFLFDCDEEKWSGIDIDDAIDSELCEWFEDAAQQINHYDELKAFISEWNAKQTLRQYYINYGRILILDKTKFNELLKQYE